MMESSQRRRTLRALAAAILAACAASPLAAQERPVPRVGDRVRVSSGAIPGTVRGELVRVANDSLYVRPEGSPLVAVPLAEVQRIEVRHRRLWADGSVRGVLIGAPAGGATVFLFATLAEQGHCADECGLYPGILGLGGAVAGAVLGAIIGGAEPGGRWVPAARPDGDGVALSLRIRL